MQVLPSPVLTGVFMSLEERILAEIGRMASATDRRGGFPHEALKLPDLRNGLAAVAPAEFGGAGLGSDALGGVALARLLTDIGRADLSLGRLVEGHVNAARLVFAYAGAPLRQIVAADIRAGHLLATWNTEPPHATLRALPEGEMLVLDGEKAFASGVGYVDRAVVSLFDADGARRLAYIAFDPKTTKQDWWDLPAMRAAATGSIVLSGVRLSRDSIFGSDEDYLKEPDFSAGAWRTLAVQLGGMQALAALVKAHLIATAQHEAVPQQQRFAALILHCQTAELWVETCARGLEQPTIDPAAAVALVNTARMAILEAAESVIALSKRSIGARAFMPGQPAERMLRDLDFYLRQPAPDQTLLDVARYHLGAPDRSISLTERRRAAG